MTALLANPANLILAVLAVMIVIAIIKGAWKIMKFLIFAGVVYFVLTYFGII